MRKKHTKFQRGILQVSLALSLLCVGCEGKKGGADKQDISADLESIQDASEADTVGTEQAPIAEEKYTFEVKSDTGLSIQVPDLVVRSAINDSPCIYEVEQTRMDDDDIRAFADILFDDKNYEVLTPYYLADEEFLRKELAYYKTLEDQRDEEFLAKNTGNEVAPWMMLDSEIGEIDGYLTESMNRPICAREDYDILCPTETNETTGEVDCYQGLLRGTVDGEIWLLSVSVVSSERGVQNQIHAYSLSEVYVTNTQKMDAPLVYGANRSEETSCLAAAQRLYRQLGFSDTEPYRASQNEIWYYTTQPAYDKEKGSYSFGEYEIYVDGYTYVFPLWEERAPEDEPFMRNLAYETVLYKSKYPGVAVSPMMSVNTQQGVASSVYIPNYMPKRTVVQENCELLSREVVMEYAQEFIREFYGETGFDGTRNGFDGTLSNCKLELRYAACPMYDEEEKLHIDILPVWVFFEMDAGTLSADGENKAVFGICAVDGTMVLYHIWQRPPL